MTPSATQHRRILLVEDDYYIATDLARALQARKIEVIGPFAESAGALTALEKNPVDAAILDVQLADENALGIADALSARAIPFVFATGVDADAIPEYLHDVPRLEKPFHIERVIDWLSGTFAPPEGAPVEPSATFENRLLRQLPADDIARLRPHMSRVYLKRRAILMQPNRPIDRVYFPETGMFSLLANSGDRAVEVGLIGREGVAGPAVLAGVDSMPLQTIVQVDGEAVAVPVAALRDVLQTSPGAALLLARANYLLSVQISFTAFASAAFTIEQRLARWLLMCQDRVGDNLSIVHEFLSLMLHVRRPSVTTALQALEGIGAITSGRGRLCIKDREKLLAVAGAAYGTPEREQQRVLAALSPNGNTLN